MRFNFIEEEMFFATAHIKVRDPVTEKGWSGTGFLFRQPIPTPEPRVATYLVSCRHVLGDGSGLLQFTLISQETDPATGKEVFVRSRVGPDPYGNTYLSHPDPKVDLAAVNTSLLLDKMQKAGSAAFNRHFTPDDYVDLSRDVMAPTQEAIFVGYPLGFYDDVNELPIMRMAHIATLPGVDFRGEQVFLIDGHVHRNSSGSPVTVRIGGRMRLVGVVSSMFGHWEKIKSS